MANSKQLTADEAFEKALAAENEAVVLKMAGDHRGARGMRQMAQSYLDDACELDQSKAA